MSSKTATLLPPAERAARQAEKQKIVLEFLRDEIWTHGDVVAELLGFKSRQAGHKALSALARAGLVRQAKVETAWGRPVSIWGITSHGQAMAWPLDAEPPENPRTFEPSKIKPSTMAHHLDIQKARISAARSGWKGWQAGDAVFQKERKMKYPDAIATAPDGARVAIEVERTIKSKKRYSEIIVSHLLARRAGHYQRVMYRCPDPDLTARLARVFDSIKSVRYGAKSITLTDEHRQIFEFKSYADAW